MPVKVAALIRGLRSSGTMYTASLVMLVEHGLSAVARSAVFHVPSLKTIRRLDMTASLRAEGLRCSSVSIPSKACLESIVIIQVEESHLGR